MSKLLQHSLASTTGLFARSTWSLGRKISAILFALMLVVVATCVATILLLVNLNNDNQERNIATDRVQTAEQIKELLNSELELYSDAVLVSQRTSVNDIYTNRLNTAMIEFSRIEFPNSLSGNRIKSYLSDLLKLYPKLGDVMGQLNGYLTILQFKEALTLYQSNLSLFSQMKDLVANLQQETQAEQVKLSGNVQNTINSSLLIACLLAVFTLVALIAVAFFLTYALSRAIRQIKLGLDQVAAGDLNVVIVTEHRDEIGEVVNVINSALELLRQVLASSAIGQRVTSLAEDLAAASTQQSSLAQAQASAVIQSSTAMEELGMTIRNILSNSVEVADAATSAMSEAEEVQQGAKEVDNSSMTVYGAVTRSNSVTNQMTERIEALALQLNELAVQSQQVAEVTSFIGEVAQQTHILSINAAIEAAGAGVYGERFAVVANQVKELAKQTDGSIAKIGGLLTTIQSNIQSAAVKAEALLNEVSQLHTAEDAVTKGLHELIENARRAVGRAERITNVTQTTVTLVQQIQQSIRNHESASSQLISSLIEIKSAAETNSQSSKTLEANSNHLEQLSQQLSSALGKVKLA